MYQEILKQRKTLETKKPFSPEVTKQINIRNTSDSIYGDLLLHGTRLSRENVEAMIDGELVTTATLWECVFVDHARQVLEQARHWSALDNRLDLQLLQKVHRMFTGKESKLRRSCPVIPDLSYVPVHQSEIEKRLKELFQAVYETADNPIAMAAFLHCEMFRIYPFKEYSEIIARFAMNYYLVEHGFLPVQLGFSRNEYLNTMRRALGNENSSVFQQGLERAIYNKLEVTIQLGCV